MTDILALAIIGLTIYLCLDGFAALTKREKEARRLLKQLEAGYFDKEVGK